MVRVLRVTYFEPNNVKEFVANSFSRPLDIPFKRIQHFEGERRSSNEEFAGFAKFVPLKFYAYIFGQLGEGDPEKQIKYNQDL